MAKRSQDLNTGYRNMNCWILPLRVIQVRFWPIRAESAYPPIATDVRTWVFVRVVPFATDRLRSAPQQINASESWLSRCNSYLKMDLGIIP